MNRHQFEAIINAIDEPAILLNRDYQIVAANQRYMEHYSERPKGRKCYEVSHGYEVPCDLAGEHCPLRQSLESKERERVLHIHNTQFGKEHVDVELTPVTDEDTGEIEYFVEVMTTVVPAASDNKNMLGYSPAFNQMLDLLNRAAPSQISVLLLGESGTGKELAAQYLHEHSLRSHKPFVTVECSGLSEHLFESELFGHEKGAFTGAINRKPGLVDAAHGGTLFLDEVGDIPMSMQVKLLRLIETGTYRAVGSVVEKQADFRLVCATHQNIHAMIDQGRFRQDLYFRISPYPVTLPPLRKRSGDVELIAQAMLDTIAPDRKLRLSKAAKHWLNHHPFEGNIRELRNLMERASLLCDGKSIEVRHLSEKRPSASHKTPDLIPLQQHEQTYLRQIQTSFKGDNKALAQALGISERTLYRKLKQLDS